MRRAKRCARCAGVIRPPPRADPLLTRDFALAEISISAYSGTAGLGPAQLAALEKAIGDAAEDDILWRAILNNLLTAMHYQLSDFARAYAAGEAALHNYAQASASNGLAHTHLHLGLIELELTHYLAALEHFQSAKTYYNAGEGDGIGCAFADVLAAEALYEQGQLDEARALCAAALPAMEEGEHLYPVFVSAYYTLSGIASLQDGLSAGLSVLAEAMRVVRRRRLPEVERMIDLRRAELQLQAGEFSQLHAESVEKVEASWDGSESGSARTWNETDRRMLLNARLALQDGDHRGCRARDARARSPLHGGRPSATANYLPVAPLGRALPERPPGSGDVDHASGHLVERGAVRSSGRSWKRDARRRPFWCT